MSMVVKNRWLAAAAALISFISSFLTSYFDERNDEALEDRYRIAGIARQLGVDVVDK